MKTLIFTDLDGTLLDSKTFSFHAAQSALRLIRSEAVPLILCSSKTGSELEFYQKRLKIRHPYVFENGGAIFIPERYFSFSIPGTQRDKPHVIRIGLPYGYIRMQFLELRKQFKVAATGFGDMSVRQVAEATGLSLRQAALARRREFSEPFILKGPGRTRLLRGFEERGLSWTRGEMYCVMGKHDKGEAVRLLKKLYEKDHGKIITIGLGDALNDLPMLREVDHPVLVGKKDNTYDRSVRVRGLIRAPGAGPEGWNRAVLDLLSR